PDLPSAPSGRGFGGVPQIFPVLERAWGWPNPNRSPESALVRACGSHQVWKNSPMQFAIEQMRAEHIAAISAIDRAVYPVPWPVHSYRSELHNRTAYYIVACRVDADAHVDTPAAVAAGGGTAGPGLLSRLARLLRPGTTVSVAEEIELRRVVGYAGLWLMVNEAHITTIAVAPDYQGHGVGELLLLALIDRAIQLDALNLTLEVPVTNHL